MAKQKSDTNHADTQNAFFHQLIQANQVVEIYLRDRKLPLKGLILSFDLFTIAIANEEKTRLVPKHAIDYIEPANFSVKKFIERLEERKQAREKLDSATK